MKRPSFQMYQGDWLSNQKLRRCSFALRGVWIDTLCLMADSDEYGVMRCPLQEIANAVGCKLKDLRELHDKGVLKGADVGERMEALTYTPRHAGRPGDTVILLPAQAGPIWYSSRMVRDEYIRTKRATQGQDEGQPKGGIGGTSGDHPSRARSRGPAQSSSASSSTSKTSKAPTAADAAPPGFEDLWQAYPKRAGNNPKARAERCYRARIGEKHSAQEMLDGAARYAKFCLATGKTGTELVLQTATFLGPDKGFLLPWTLSNGGGRWDADEKSILAKAKELGIGTLGQSKQALVELIRQRLSQ